LRVNDPRSTVHPQDENGHLDGGISENFNFNVEGINLKIRKKGNIIARNKLLKTPLKMRFYQPTRRKRRSFWNCGWHKHKTSEK
jgi:hypothetical protein